MSNVKSLHHCHVAWSKNQKDKFIAISTDVKLFEFTNQTQSHASHQQLQQQQAYNQYHQSNTSYQHVNQTPVGTGSLTKQSTASLQKNFDHFMNSRLIATGPEISNFRAVSCYPGSISEDDTLVAISCSGSQNTSKIVLVCLRPSALYSIDNYIHVDLVTKKCVCNDVDWSLVNNSLLATGWDRYKLDNSLQIFDINRMIDPGKYSFNFSVSPNNRPVFDGCQSEHINSLKWFRKEQAIVCGSNGKQVRIFDIRDLAKSKLSAQTRAVYGVTVDAFSDKRFASFVENSIYIWDLRFFDKPIVTILESKPISQISWCPTRNHAFSALMSGEHFVKIYDIQQASLFSDDFDAKIVERFIHPFAASSSITPSGSVNTSSDPQNISGPISTVQKQVTSYDWHPTADSRLIAISNTRDVIALNVCDRITLNWSPICEIVWTKGKRILQCLDSRDEKYRQLDDISVNMRHRAITSYGLIVEDGPHHQRGDDSDLIGLLRWVKLAKSLGVCNIAASKQQKSTQKIKYQSDSVNSDISGVGTLIHNNRQQTPSRGEIRTINWTGSSSYLVAPIRVQVYHSDLRSRALLLCDWIPDIDNVSSSIPIIDYLEKERNYIRAAAIAVFNMRLPRAIESLTIGAKGGDSSLSTVAMALSGFTGERTSIWREMCQNLKNQLKNPYMKAMFAFLTNEGDSGFNEIIHDKDLILVDRVAFSLLYLNDDMLNEYLNETMATLVENGDLNGILLTGITNNGLELLQRYIEISSDIQSVSLIVLHSLPSSICNDPRARLWVECYRSMLDCWRLWHQRAHFDNLWFRNAGSLAKPPIHVLINCNHCGNPINRFNQAQQSILDRPSYVSSSHQPTSSLSGQMLPSTVHQLTSNVQTSISNPPYQIDEDSFEQQDSTNLTPGLSSTSNAVTTLPVSIVTSTLNSMSLNSNSSTSTISSALTSLQPMNINVVPSSSPSYFSAIATGLPSLALGAGSSQMSSLSAETTQSSSMSANTIAPNPTSSLNPHQTTIQQQTSHLSSTSSTLVPRKNCVNCKKCSYAKCCLCLTQLGSTVISDQRPGGGSFGKASRSDRSQNTQNPVEGLSSSASKNKPPNASASASVRTNQLSNWFSWCQTCRHGAHSAHLLSWFSENSECPVSGCDCKCMNLDSRAKYDSGSYSPAVKFHSNS